jgi:sirohydrochlorin ferrochelatase
VEPAPALVACAHGTRDPAGRRTVDALRDAVGARRPGLRVVEAYVDVQEPSLPLVLGGLGSAVVVPLLLSAGYHVNVDVATAVDSAGPGVRRARALGPDGVLAEVLAERLDRAGLADHAVVLAAAGSSDHRAVRDVEQAAHDLGRLIARDVVAAYASAAEPRVGDAASALAAEGRRVAVASYVMAPGFFYDRLREVPADLHTAPLLPHPAIVDLVLRRYDEAVTAASPFL